MHKGSTSTCLCERYYTPHGTGYDILRAINLCADAGFDVQDINFSHTEVTSPLAQDDWERWIGDIAALLEQRRIAVEQTHLHWYRCKEMHSAEEEAWNRDIILRSMHASGRFGKDIAVVAHTNTVYDAEGYSYDKSLRMNLDFFKQIGEIAARQGNRIAIEILFPTEGTMFGCCADDLMELLTRLNDPLFGICWDFGHANLARLDQVSSLRMIGRHLIATHCQDNYGILPDIHLLPFYGKIDWRLLMNTLREIDYQGNLDLEVHMFTRTLPMDLQLECCRTSHHVVNTLVRMLEGDYPEPF